MEFTREIYWNVGHGVLIPMYLLTFIAIGIMIFGFYKRYLVYKMGGSENRLDSLFDRIFYMLRNVFSQQKVIRERIPGIFHGIFFWGFLLLFIGTLLVFLQADFTNPLFGIKFLTGIFYLVFSLVLDLAGLAAIVMLSALLIRRFFIKPEGLETIRDDYIIHSILLVILITGFVIEGLRMSVTELGSGSILPYFSPVGMFAANIFAGFDAGSLQGAHKFIWWFHFLLAMTFIGIIPFTKLRHIFTTSANLMFHDNRPKGFINTPDLEDEQSEQFGCEQLTDFTWKDIFDGDACTKCKRCQDRCPAYATDKPLSPMKVIQQFQEAAFYENSENMVDFVTPDVLWSCTTCRACQETCPADIEHVNKILEMRRNMVLMKGEFPGDEVVTAADSLEVNGNPLGFGFAKRGDWADGLDVSLMSEQADMDILYFPGCFASFDKRNITVAKNFISICNELGLKVGILGKEEKCCGEPARKLGNEYLYQMTAMENIEKFSEYNVKRIVTTCPHCFNTLSKDYRELGMEQSVQVEHYTTFLYKMFEKQGFSLEMEDFDCTYHDSCYMARYNDILEEPRSLITSAGGRINEMDKNRYESFCCGGGGGRILVDEKIGTKVNAARAKMASDTGSGVLISNCPFCLSMFEDGIKTAEVEDKIKVRDISEIIVGKIKRRS
ncbi:MAG: 4Fe-4S dicluster domain-containing protein [Flexistipes sinusarabici]|uniref:4Fe-4S dicluster domain-containing protein n=1 Tax=Flexistipes sinusarabici TaxID=2352 RepID=A0A5D0MLZ8_FLESI|nr:heterodisulfide reductase-related iron-sulfur binding cluster [Flexistipes sinusarabici]TYB34727.1 MAG: 4Fe-4S dicluster domain-containing protein [Flexistipes sinusarabici]